MLGKRLRAMISSMLTIGAGTQVVEDPRLVRKAPVNRADRRLVEKMRSNDKERDLAFEAKRRIQKAEEKRKRKQEKLKKLSQR